MLEQSIVARKKKEIERFTRDTKRTIIFVIDHEIMEPRNIKKIAKQVFQ